MSGELNRPEVMLDVLDEHLEELDFALAVRASVLRDPSWDLLDLAALEERIDAHADGLEVGQAYSAELAVDALADGSSSRVAAGALTLLRLGPSGHEALAHALASLPATALDGVRHATLLATAADVAALRPALEAMLRSPESTAAAAFAIERAAALGLATSAEAIAAVLDAALPLAVTEDESAWSDDAVPALLALRAAVVSPGALDPDRLRIAATSPNPLVRRAALHAGAECGLAETLAVCRSGETAEALEVLGAIGSAADLPRFEAALRDDALAHGAVAGLAALGSAEVLPLLIEAMRREAVADAAAAAFAAVTGFDPGTAASSDEDDGDDEYAPSPDAEAAQLHVEAERERYGRDASVRWCGGRPLPAAPALPEAFDELSLAARHCLYVAARMTDVSQPLRDLEARARRQLGLGPLS